MSPKKYLSAFERLSAMPAVFSLNTLVRWTGLSRASAKVMVSRWAASGMVESAGPRAGIYFNRVVDRNGEQATAVKALMMKYPSATLCGASVLHSASWTTQIPSTLHVAIEPRTSFAQINGVTLWSRPIRWFREMQDRGAWYGSAQDGAEKDEMPTFGLRALKPEWALADLYADHSGQAWQPDEDDLDIPDEDLAAVTDACRVMGSVPEWMDDEPARSPRQRG